MISILQKTTILLFLFWAVPSLANIQYKPISSVERSGFYFGGTLENKFVTEEESFFSGYSFKYDFFIPEINNLVGENYRDIFKFSLGVGSHFFKAKYKNNKSLCESSKQPQALLYYGGLKGILAYFEYFTPFVEFGLVRSHCFSYDQAAKKLSFSKASQEMKSYLSFGLFLSFKMLDRVSIYSLDRDYGINDVGVTSRCSWFYKKEVKTKSPRKLAFCEVGLSFKL